VGKIIAIANQKGGVGKTTTAINLSACLAAAEIPTLVIDFDPQSNTTSGLSALCASPPARRSVYELFASRGVQAADLVLPTQMEYLFLMPSSRDLIGAEVELMQEKKREYVFRSALEDIRGRYTYVLVDLPPSLGLLTVNALTACDSVLIPLQCEYLALEGLGALLDTIDRIRMGLNAAIEIEGILLTMHDLRYNISRQVEENVRSHFGPLVFKTIISRSVRLAEAPSHGRPILLYDVKSRGAQQYMSLATELIGRENH
jgi:chromosome partitioning protein